MVSTNVYLDITWNRANGINLTTTSDDPKCSCQPAPRKHHYKRPPPIEAILRGPEKDQVRQLSQPGIDLDVTFLPVEQLVILREMIPGPNPYEKSCKTYIQLNMENSTFVNIQGLPNNSIRLTVQIDKAGKYLKPQQKYMCYWPDLGESKLYNDLVLCDWSQMTLSLQIPGPRAKGWKTVALILRTFGRISNSTWDWFVALKDPPAVAGLDWEKIEMEIKSEEAEDCDTTVDEGHGSGSGPAMSSFELV